VKIDLNNDEIITEKELDLSRQIADLRNDQLKWDAQRHMAWVAMWSMVFTVGVILTSFIGGERVQSIRPIIEVFIFAQSGVVAFFFGFSAWLNKK
jgi:hypothetical protein|tara:strand:- start:162 stop:446 length:285 start_codon:yes stop_codon:yes gene_type:complete